MKDGTCCMCVDFRSLNKTIIKNQYPLPKVNDLIHQFLGAPFFTKLDLKYGAMSKNPRGGHMEGTIDSEQGIFEW
jgi:hypothetical protein